MEAGGQTSLPSLESAGGACPARWCSETGDRLGLICRLLETIALGSAESDGEQSILRSLEPEEDDAWSFDRNFQFFLGYYARVSFV